MDKPLADERVESLERDVDAEDRRAILSRRARLLSLALAGVAIAAVAPSENPVCAQHNVPGGAPVRMRLRARPDAAQIAHSDASTPVATIDAGASDDELPDIEALPEETIDATVLVPTRPQVCLSNVPHDEPAQGCGCRRTTPSGSAS